MIGPGRPHPVLQELFADLESRGVAWMVLRTPRSLAEPAGDIDILVAPADFARLRGAALRLGFVALPGWDSPANLVLLSYDAPTRRWLVLDVVTELGFRALPGRRPRPATDLLARRRLRDGIALPADGDAFWLLLGHCLLDRGTVAPHYRQRLRELAAAGGRSELGPALLAPAGWAPPALVAAVRDGDWDLVEALGRRLTAELRRRRGAAERLRGLALAAAAMARKPRLLRRRHGLSLALLGPNGVGKSTLAEALRRDFPLESRVIHMGLWKARGPAAPVLRPVRIWARYLQARYHQLRGRLVIFDRYVDEARLPAQGALLALKRPYFWLLAHAVPPAGATVVLDVPGSVAYARKQENPPDELERERRVYLALAGAQVVDASREPAEVRADVEAIVWRGLARRWADR